MRTRGNGEIWGLENYSVFMLVRVKLGGASQGQVGGKSFSICRLDW